MIYSLHKCRHILVRLVIKLEKQKRLSSDAVNRWYGDLRQLEQAIGSGNRKEADRLARALETQGRTDFAQPTWRRWLGTAGALIVALVLAIVIRTMWFELYSIPTGSMRPTLEEQNRLIVSKISYGLNVPLVPAHFYFDPDLAQRTDLIVFSTANLPIANSETLYFYLFPTHKQYVKRLLGKPGDTVYFYGGRLYGMDRDGHDLLMLRNSPDIAPIEYVPMISWDGRAVPTVAPTSTPQGPLMRGCRLDQLGQPVARLNWNGREVVGEIETSAGWVRDNSAAAGTPHKEVQTYSDFWGLRNYAMARLLTADELRKWTPWTPAEVGEGLLYLELFHTPSTSYPAPEIGMDRMGTIRPRLTPRTTVVPLDQPALDRLMDRMQTSRFVVRSGRALPWAYEGVDWDLYKNISVTLEGVPDGTYELIRGTAYRIWWSGVRTRLDLDHPLYSHTPERIATLYNLGIEWLSLYAPRDANGPLLPSRFAYFRDGELWSLAGPLLGQDDPLLESFLQREMARQTASSPTRPYVAFRDWGPPLRADGSIDPEQLRAFGFRVPEGHYLALGDNHAVSLDSRDFGTVPQANLNGSPLFVFWPPGVQWGTLPQPGLIWWSLPHLLVWGLALIIYVGWIMLMGRRYRYALLKLKNHI